LPEIQDQTEIYEAERLLRNPPKGAWVRKNSGQERIGAVIKSKGAAVMFIFSIIFTGTVVFGFMNAVSYGRIILFFFMAPFAAASVLLWYRTFLSLFGKIELVINRKEPDYLFTGIGTIGKKRVVNWQSLSNIYEKETFIETDPVRPPASPEEYNQKTGYTVKHIYLEGENTVKISANGISEEKRKFLIGALKYYLDLKTRYQQFY